METAQQLIQTTIDRMTEAAKMPEIMKPAAYAAIREDLVLFLQEFADSQALAELTKYELAMRGWDDLTLASFNSSIKVCGHVQPGTAAWNPSLDAGLVDENGVPRDEDVGKAAVAEINRRVLR